ncbi:MAG: AAA family ATPase, partial [Pseudonocardiaceae bacterium]
MSVWASVVGQDPAVAALQEAARSAAIAIDRDAPRSAGAMTHAWLFTGPPGSGRSVAARAFAAALQCTDAEPGCGACQGCRTTLAGTHADVREVVPEGLSISVAEMRALVAGASRRPSAGRWQVLLIEDADRLTEGAANALLKAVEEPPPRTVFVLCAPSDHPEDIAVTLRSRCRPVGLRTPPAAAVGKVLEQRDGLDAA